jgi:fermentation-respiration switch protein FrsA (DUF1100 family)
MGTSIKRDNMKKGIKITLIVFVVILVIASAALMYITRTKAIELVYQPIEIRNPITESPADYSLPYEEVSVTTTDGFTLAGWFVPSQNGAVIIAQHGFRGGRNNMLYDADLLSRHGYGVLMSSFRAHDVNPGEMVTFGKMEVLDLDAWYQYLITRTDIDPKKIGILGESMGGMVTIQYAAQNPNLRAVAVHSSFTSIDAAAGMAVEHFTGLPAFPFAPLIVWWGEQLAGFDSSEMDATRWIGQISPRPVFIMMGGQDDHIPAASGQWLYDAANEPKELWFVPDATHHGIPEIAPEEYEQRLTEFYDQYILGE